MALDISKADAKNEQCWWCIIFALILRKTGKMPCWKCKHYLNRKNKVGADNG